MVGPVLGAVVAALLYEALRGGEEHAQGVPNNLALTLEKVHVADAGQGVHDRLQ